MRRLLLTALVLLTTAIPVAATEVQSFAAHYKLSNGVLTLGAMSLSLKVDADTTYQFTSEIKTKGLVSLFANAQIHESSSGHLVNGQFKPAAYRYAKGDQKRDFALRFDHAAGRVERSDGDDWHATLPNGALDKLVFQAQLMLDLETSSDSIEYTVADKDKLKSYVIAKLGREELETPLGRFDTVKVERNKTNSKRRTRVWFAPDLGWVPIKVEHRDKRGSTTIARIIELERF